jgi:hypothetical protein
MVSWGRTPPAGGESAAFQDAAGQLGQGVGAALGAVAVVLGAGGAGQGFQGGQEGGAGLGVQQPIHGDHAIQGGGGPQAAPLLLPLEAFVAAVGVGDLAQIGDRLAQPGWVQPAG